MPRADTLTVVHHDDTETTYTEITGYQLHRDGVRIFTPDGETVHTDVLMTHAYRCTTQQPDGRTAR
jgi:hypothetical protein